MRPRRIDHFDFTMLASLYVIVFCLQLAMLLFVGYIAFAPPPPGDRFEIITDPTPAEFPSGPGLVIRAEPASRVDVERAVPILHLELSRYPQSLLKRIGLRRIVLCANLSVNGRRQGGLALGPYGVAFLDISPTQWIPYAFHHELFHVMDVILLPKSAWARWNPADFQYGGNEILDALDITGENPGGPTEIAGFLNSYSLIDAREDRAEIYTYLITNPDGLKRIGLGDEIIRKKTLALRRELIGLSRDFGSILAAPEDTDRPR